MSNNKDAEQPKIGVYVCHCGGNISDEVDVQSVVEAAGKLDNVVVARENTFMCSDPGQELIMEDIKSGLINRVVVASCAPSLHEMTFRGAISRAGMNPYLYEHANIREQVSWVHHGAAATPKAAALVAAAVGKAGELKQLEPIRVDAKRHATVVGGGVAGLSAAKNLAAAGIDVTLVEKSPFLGGQMSQLDKTFPTGETAGELISALVEQVMAAENIEVITCAEIKESSGYVGNFQLKLEKTPPTGDNAERLVVAKQADSGVFVPFVGVLAMPEAEAAEEIELTSGAIILATGFEHYQPRTGEYGYGEHEGVITLLDLIKLTADQPAQGGKLMFNGQPVNNMAIIHCVGSRQIPGINEPPEGGQLNEHCSRVCCTASLQAACEVREKYPETQVFDFYRDIRTYGRGHEDYYLDAGKAGVIFSRFLPETPPQIGDGDGESPMTVTVADTLLSGEEIEVGVDLVVLAVGMEPRRDSNLSELMKLPLGADRFLLEVHPKLRPVELPSAGFYLAGACQAPMDSSESVNAAAAAAAKAGAILGPGVVELDPFVAKVDPNKCIGSGECQKACIADGAIEITETEAGPRAEINPALCMGCGVCVAACDQGAIELAGWSLKQYEAMVDGIVAQALGTPGE